MFYAEYTRANCRDSLLNAVPSADVSWVDQDTPDDQCSIQLKSDTLQLVFSDEFNVPGRKFGVLDRDPKWTAQDFYYSPTNNLEVCKPSQVTTRDGDCVITIEKGRSTAYWQNTTGDVLLWEMDYKSGFVDSWNKFCFTGGYIETRVQLPGNGEDAGFWPAFWTMGNLGRAGYKYSTGGFWPYSYDTCPPQALPGPWSKLAAQNISACPDVPPYDRQEYGLLPNQGRGAPEFDVFEVSVKPSPHASQTLQMAPQLPGYARNWPKSGGVSYPGSNTKFKTQNNPYFSGNEYQDSISALSSLDSSFFTGFHTFGVDWSPGQYLRWYIDGTLLYEITQKAVNYPLTDGSWSVGPRSIPLEPAYIIFNLGISPDFLGVTKDDFLQNYLPKLQFPAQYKLDYIRVYQKPDSYNVGCSPPDYPTEQYISCYWWKYRIQNANQNGDQLLIPSKCNAPDPPRPPNGEKGLTIGAVFVIMFYILSIV